MFRLVGPFVTLSLGISIKNISQHLNNPLPPVEFKKTNVSCSFSRPFCGTDGHKDLFYFFLIVNLNHCGCTDEFFKGLTDFSGQRIGSNMCPSKFNRHYI